MRALISVYDKSGILDFATALREMDVDIVATDGTYEVLRENGVEVSPVVDAIEARYPMLIGTIRDHITKERRPFLRFFACEEDLSHASIDAPLPDAVAEGKEPLLIVGAIAGGV